MPTIQDENKGADKDEILSSDLSLDKEVIIDDYIPILHVEVKMLTKGSLIILLDVRNSCVLVYLIKSPHLVS